MTVPADPPTAADLARWLELADESTPGPYRVEQGITHLEVRAAHQTERAVARVYCDIDAEFIAHGDPGRVRAVVGEVRRLRAQLADHWPASGPTDGVAASHQQRDRLYALCCSVGVVRENQWLSEAAVAAIEKLLAENAALREALRVIHELADEELGRLGAVPGSNIPQIEANARAALESRQ